MKKIKVDSSYKRAWELWVYCWFSIFLSFITYECDNIKSKNQNNEEDKQEVIEKVHNINEKL